VILFLRKSPSKFPDARIDGGTKGFGKEKKRHKISWNGINHGFDQGSSSSLGKELGFPARNPSHNFVF
jgi:hypothetical protein